MSKSYHAPIRPPRGSKVSKDSGRLINIIAELSVSKSNDDRKRKMQELNKDMMASDGRLVKLLSVNRDKLTVIMETFSRISAKINTSRKGCRDVKTKLIACKKLLECKREEIKRLWSESVEHECVLNMFKEIDALNNIHGKVEDCLERREFFKATELLVGGVSLLEGKLSEADALKEVKTELGALKKKLHNVFVQELIQLIYKSPSDVFLSKSTDGRSKSYDELFNAKVSVMKLPLEGSSFDFSPSQKKINDEIKVILECISLLNTVPETIEVLKETCSKQLMCIIRNSSEAMYEAIQNSPYPCKMENFCEIKEQPHYLRDLLKVILNQFRQVSINHCAFLDNLERIAMTNSTDIGLSTHYEMADIYSKLQSAVELFLSDYLDVHNTSASERVATQFSKLPTNISSFFLRKGNITRTKRKPNSLYQFDSSSHAINKKMYLQDQREKDNLYPKEKGELDSVESDRNLLISQPNAKNIKVVYKILRNFISEIETALRLETGSQCPLHNFLGDCVKLFLDQVNMEVNRLIETSSISLESWKPVSDPDQLKLAEVKAPQILNSALSVMSSLKEMEQLIYNLPDYSSHFLHLICNVLENYKEMCNSAYKSLIYADSEEQRIFSVSWARDPDISRLLRSLPNWTNLTVDSLDERNVHDFEESPEEVRFRNKAESELLIRNLCNHDRTISPCEIISEHSKLTNLSLMHESMEFFATEIISFAERLPDFEASVSTLYLNEKFNDDGDSNFEKEVGVSMSTKSCLKKLAKDFEELASTSLLVLHLEVRAHCFFYLLKLSKTYSNRKDDEEPEPEVLKFNADITKIDESLSPVLQPKKMRYIFEGLGELLSTILINSVANIKKINEVGVKKIFGGYITERRKMLCTLYIWTTDKLPGRGRNIFAIQQNLAGITMTREVALDRARQYFDLLNHSFEDILNQIVEEGPQFQEQEYSFLIQLLHNSREGHSEQSLNYYLEKLRQILDEVPVSV